MEVIPQQLDSIRNQLMSLTRKKKPLMLVVDDEPDNLDLLYRAFRRDFNVLKAESGIKALEILALEGEVAIIISDQRMPEMKGTEFLSKTLPQFPNTIRIILTGFTDVEDLVEAINYGQVYKYITKPWDPNELKKVVQKAAQTYQVLNQRTEYLEKYQTQLHLLNTVVHISQKSESIEEALAEISSIYNETFSTDVCILQLVENNSLSSIQGFSSRVGQVDNWLTNDPLAIEAITSGNVQSVINVSENTKLSDVVHYQALGIETHLVIPIFHRQKLLALMSLQWQKNNTLDPEELSTINISAQLLALSLNNFK
ncbi:putative GAF sensor protein [Trichodesmium erythraeum IMS101]|uniref:Putative GAF sensor protein n=1 Tax=Trichodesmium erythraeum (strain IMS101) TaxID=203124 RepID=Q10XM8_TRIEI|nr:response regulator [Trichodesmium erythraeum GBRTRLIN201]MCH2048300.1 response regulator [Trichodesmium sp. ALOHA_ZT_67]MDE5096221.1 response regulator [Trichodesmium sp. St11_bin5]MDT9339948.1 response regulator [Trichodesmium erythraeum 21-75]